MSELSASARETVASDTPSSRAMSLIPVAIRNSTQRFAVSCSLVQDGSPVNWLAGTGHGRFSAPMRGRGLMASRPGCSTVHPVKMILPLPVESLVTAYLELVDAELPGLIEGLYL